MRPEDIIIAPVITEKSITLAKENEPGGISISLRISLNRPRVYLKTPNAPGQRVFLRCAASFFLEIRQYSCEKCLAQRKNPSLPVTS